MLFRVVESSVQGGSVWGSKKATSTEGRKLLQEGGTNTSTNCAGQKRARHPQTPQASLHMTTWETHSLQHTHLELCLQQLPSIIDKHGQVQRLWVCCNDDTHIHTHAVRRATTQAGKGQRTGRCQQFQRAETCCACHAQCETLLLLGLYQHSKVFLLLLLLLLLQ